jgi:hypothetical protein
VEQGIDFETLVKKKFEGKQEKEENSTSDPGAQVQQEEPEDEHEDISEQLDATPNKSEVEGEKPAGIISKEERQLGNVTWGVYRDYFSAYGNLWIFFGMHSTRFCIHFA